ncbi:MAG: hypothetical protein JEZ10_03885 [Verrucomicrobia bacterium]|nr:hypothetical protein [Verrucomicrobiota bacterium]
MPGLFTRRTAKRLRAKNLRSLGFPYRAQSESRRTWQPHAESGRTKEKFPNSRRDSETNLPRKESLHLFDTLRRLRLFRSGVQMNPAEAKKLVQVVGGICAVIGTGTPQPAGRGLAFVLATLAKTPKAVDQLAAAAKAIIQKGEA